jgi:hypothetical protein
MKFSEISGIKNALEQLGNERLPIWYEIAKNIRICNKVIDEVQAIAKELFEGFADKDENGKLKQFEENGRSVSKITDPEKLKAYSAEVEKLDKDDHEITFHKVSLKKIESEKLQANVLVPLLDTIFTAE